MRWSSHSILQGSRQVKCQSYSVPTTTGTVLLAACSTTRPPFLFSTENLDLKEAVCLKPCFRQRPLLPEPLAASSRVKLPAQVFTSVIRSLNRMKVFLGFLKLLLQGTFLVKTLI